MATEIIFSGSISTEHQAELSHYLELVKWLIPSWCRRLHVYMSDSDGMGKLAEIDTNYDYRFSEMTIFTNWFNRKDSVKIQSIIHEFIHINTSPVSQFATEGLERFEDDNEMVVAVVVDELNSKDEQATEDLAMAIYDQFYRKEFEPDSQ